MIENHIENAVNELQVCEKFIYSIFDMILNHSQFCLSELTKILKKVISLSR